MERRHAAKDLYLTMHCGADHHTACLFKLIIKSDPENKRKLTVCYPVEVSILREWNDYPSEYTFFQKYKVGELLSGEMKADFTTEHDRGYLDRAYSIYVSHTREPHEAES